LRSGLRARGRGLVDHAREGIDDLDEQARDFGLEDGESGLLRASAGELAAELRERWADLDKDLSALEDGTEVHGEALRPVRGR
jgi:hypothetical protein